MGKLLHTEQQLLYDFAAQAEGMFGKTIYQVGSSLQSINKDKPHRDIDLRVMLEPNEFKRLQKLVNISRLNLAISLWGQKVTGLPIDFQVQDRIYANERHSSKDGKYRSAVSIGGIQDDDGYAPPKQEVDTKGKKL